jgi:hypothetical protein
VLLLLSVLLLLLLVLLLDRHGRVRGRNDSGRVQIPPLAWRDRRQRVDPGLVDLAPGSHVRLFNVV